MKEVEKATDVLISAIKNSKRYTRYQDILEQIKGQKDVYEELVEFRKTYFDLTNKNDDNFDEIEKLQQKYHDLLMKSDVMDFIEATDRLCLMMRDIYIKIADEVEMDIDFIE